MLRSITFIKAVHTVIFLILSGMLLIFLFEVIIDRISILTWVALSLFLMEGIILVVNDWRCPLTDYAETLGSSHGQVTDLFLPKWFADKIFHIYGALVAVACLLLVIRLLTA